MNKKYKLTRLRARSLPETFTIRICAELIRVKLCTLNKWINQGCPAMRGDMQNWTFTKRDFLAWMIETGRFEERHWQFAFGERAPAGRMRLVSDEPLSEAAN